MIENYNLYYILFNYFHKKLIKLISFKNIFKYDINYDKYEYYFYK